MVLQSAAIRQRCIDNACTHLLVVVGVVALLDFSYQDILVLTPLSNDGCSSLTNLETSESGATQYIVFPFALVQFFRW